MATTTTTELIDANDDDHHINVKSELEKLKTTRRNLLYGGRHRDVVSRRFHRDDGHR